MIDLEEALKISQNIAAKLMPHCQRVEIAGAVRRQMPLVGCISLVVLPKRGELDRLIARCLSKTTLISHAGETLALRLKTGEEVYITIATDSEDDLLGKKPGNFGSLLLWRTGPAPFVDDLQRAARAKGREWRVQFGVFDYHGRSMGGETEESVCEAVGLPYVPPEMRQ